MGSKLWRNINQSFKLLSTHFAGLYAHIATAAVMTAPPWIVSSASSWGVLKDN